MDKERFSLLLLEPNDIYFQDFAVDFLSTIDNGLNISDKSTGRLKLCSKSIVFDPKDLHVPLIKISYKDIKEISQETIKEQAKTHHFLRIRCSQYVEMLPNGIIEPYNFIITCKTFFFFFYYANINDKIIDLCQQLKRASSLNTYERNYMISTIVFSYHNRLKFNPLWLNDIYEKTLIDCRVNDVKPLIINPGRLLLTDSCYPVLKIKHECINSISKKRFLLRHIGLEINWEGSKSLYVSFLNKSERNHFYSVIFGQKKVNIQHIESESMTLKWQNRLISNFEYLMFLNSLADRTFQDLTQYPVFPWVLTDYESDEIDLCDIKNYRDLTKPIGALNVERLQRLKERCSEISGPKFLYGSHYSTPGFVLFYLVRKYPHLMLCLQNGRFDHPDRMFNSISETFKNCMNNMSDFKELIPEFYDISNGGDFLLNKLKINFGTRSDGTSVHNVALPPWAKNSPELFVKKMREALESDYVSINLNHWIDLIFGYKQQGEEALKANNLFYYLCYEGSVDLDTIKDLSERHALEVQIMEFGQIPKQLFQKPHVSRTVDLIKSFRINSNNCTDKFQTIELHLKGSHVAHKQPVTAICIEDDIVYSTAKDGTMKYFDLTKEHQIRSISFGDHSISTCLKLPNSNIIALGSLDNIILLYNIDFGKTSCIIPAHDGSVSCLTLVNDFDILISGSWDCCVKVWRGYRRVNYKDFKPCESLIAYFPFEDKVTCLVNIQLKNSIRIIAGSTTGDIYICTLKVLEHENSFFPEEPKLLIKHPSEVSSLTLNLKGTSLASCSLDGNIYVTDVNTGMNIFTKFLNNPVISLSWWDDLNFLFCGDKIGIIWIFDLITGSLKYREQIANGPLTCVNHSLKHELVITSGWDKTDYRIKYWSLQ